MSDPLEADLENWFLARCVENGALCLKVVCLSWAGFPDRLVLCAGRAALVELKKRHKRPEKHQSLRHGLLGKYGFNVWVVDSRESAESFFKNAEVFKL